MRTLKRVGALINEEKDYISTKKYYWHGFFVKREAVVVQGRRVVEQICISKRKLVEN